MFPLVGVVLPARHQHRRALVCLRQRRGLHTVDGICSKSASAGKSYTRGACLSWDMAHPGPGSQQPNRILPARLLPCPALLACPKLPSTHGQGGSSAQTVAESTEHPAPPRPASFRPAPTWNQASLWPYSGAKGSSSCVSLFFLRSRWALASSWSSRRIRTPARPPCTHS